MDWTCSGISHRCSIRLESGKCGGLVTLGSLLCFLRDVQEQVLWCGREHCPAGRATATGENRFLQNVYVVHNCVLKGDGCQVKCHCIVTNLN